MNEEIKQIFQNGVTVSGVTYPVAHLRYKGSSKTYVTWTITRETPQLVADDDLLYSVVSLDIDVFSDRNYIGIINAIKTLMKNNGWLWTEDSTEMYEEETELYHKTITFEKEYN